MEEGAGSSPAPTTWGRMIQSVCDHIFSILGDGHRPPLRVCDKCGLTTFIHYMAVETEDGVRYYPVIGGSVKLLKTQPPGEFIPEEVIESIKDDDDDVEIEYADSLP